MVMIRMLLRPLDGFVGLLAIVDGGSVLSRAKCMGRTNRWPWLLRLEARLALGSAAGAALVARFAGLHRGVSRLHEQWRWRDPRCLQRFEARRRSDDGEDGILREIFRRLDGSRAGARTFVEFGVGDGAQCCTRALVE